MYWPNVVTGRRRRRRRRRRQNFSQKVVQEAWLGFAFDTLDNFEEHPSF
jgi:hypothetical protein